MTQLFRRKQIILIITVLLFIFYSVKQYTISNEENAKMETIVWSDEFDGHGSIDTVKWYHQTQLPPGGAWWGGLMQHYTNRLDNSYVKGGYLHLIAKKEAYEEQGVLKSYTSVRLNSKYAFTYGRVEVRAMLPEGIGTWPAIWLLNKNIDEDGAYWDNQGYGEIKWPYCGEIDIMEHWGKDQNYISSAVHNTSSYGFKVKNLGGRKTENVSNEFHVYSLDWTQEKLTFAIDGIPHYEYKPSIKDSENWPYDTDYYLILNIAIEKDIDPKFKRSSMVLDYVRVYQQ